MIGVISSGNRLIVIVLLISWVMIDVVSICVVVGVNFLCSGLVVDVGCSRVDIYYFILKVVL